ncbi:MAG: alanine racemase [Candidatus Omnitrophota bacterium]|nr:alanine racemase [Candidatus Omnitrophota bacterium]
MMHVWVEINLNNIRHNYNLIKRKVGRSVKILAVVKSEAYGHGMVAVSRVLAEQKVDYLGVARLKEAVELRKAGIPTPILLFNPLFSEEIKLAVEYGLSSTVYTLSSARLLDKQARSKGRKARVHLKVDTGMGRAGVWHKQAFQLAKSISQLSNLKLEGIYTHFPSADEEDKAFTYKQVGFFKTLLDKLERSGVSIPCKHAANSAGILDVKISHLNLVRPGLMLYGVYPSRYVSKTLKLKPALSVKTRVSYLKPTPQGRSISYGRDHITCRPTVIAALAVGYADGYSHLLSNKSRVLVKGQGVPVAGRICMDQMMVDVGAVKDVKIGDEAVLIGSQGTEEITVEELADRCGTIPYQVLCWIGNKVLRKYKNR